MLLQLQIFLKKNKKTKNKKKKIKLKQMKQVFWPPFKLDENFHIIKFDLNFKQISVDIKIFSVLIFLTYILSHILQ